jgi:hypothetical protein
MSTPDLLAVHQQVLSDLGALIEALDTDGGVYARRYAEWVLEGSVGLTGPKPPPALLGKPAAMVRELVMDSAHARRRVPPRLAGRR